MLTQAKKRASVKKQEVVDLEVVDLIGAPVGIKMGTALAGKFQLLCRLYRNCCIC
jgi:hypothetical protein